MTDLAHYPNNDSNAPRPAASRASWGPQSRQGSQPLLAALTLLLGLALVLSSLVIAPRADAAPITSSELPASTWQVEGTVNTLLTVGQTLYVGGDFSAMYNSSGDRKVRTNLAAINLATGQPTEFAPSVNDKVFALATSTDKNTLYVGGAFTAIDGQQRKRIAAFNRSSGALTPFNPPAPNSALRAIAVTDKRIYIGGLFEKVGNEARGYAAAYWVSTGELDKWWNPQADDRVTSLLVDETKVWIGGDFNRMGGTRAANLAAVNANNGSLLSTDHPVYPVIDLAKAGNRIFVAGGGPGGRAAAYDRNSGKELWTIASDGNFQAVDVGKDFVYFGGHYTKVEGVPVGRMTRHNMATGAMDNGWLPLVNGLRSVNAVEVSSANVSIGGDFTFVSRQRQRGVAVFGALNGDVPDVVPAESPQLVALTMHDLDSNGRIDTVRARFDKDLTTCTNACAAGWKLTNTPSGATLNSVRIADRTATLRLNEGSGAPDTYARSFRVALESSPKLDQASFAATAPADKAGPVAVWIRKTNVGTAGRAEAGDTFTASFSEPLAASSLPATTTVSLRDPGNGFADRLAIGGIIDGAAKLGAPNYVVCATEDCNVERIARFTNSPVQLSNGGRVITVTLGSCTGSCGRLGAGEATDFTYKAHPSITDQNGNGAVSSMVVKTLRLF